MRCAIMKIVNSSCTFLHSFFAHYFGWYFAFIVKAKRDDDDKELDDDDQDSNEDSVTISVQRGTAGIFNGYRHEIFRLQFGHLRGMIWTPSGDSKICEPRKN